MYREWAFDFEKEIGIYPEWNVKYNKTPVNKKPLQLEYIQNGM